MARRGAGLRTHHLVAVSLATVFCAKTHYLTLVRPSGHGQSLHMADIATKLGTHHPGGEMAMQPAEPPHSRMTSKAGFIEGMASSDLPLLEAAAAYVVQKEIETNVTSRRPSSRYPGPSIPMAKSTILASAFRFEMTQPFSTITLPFTGYR